MRLVSPLLATPDLEDCNQEERGTINEDVPDGDSRSWGYEEGNVGIEF